MSDGINLGSLCRDKVTGFIGICCGIVHYLHENDKVLLEAKVNNNEYKSGIWFSRNRIEVFEE